VRWIAAAAVTSKSDRSECGVYMLKQVTEKGEPTAAGDPQQLTATKGMEAITDIVILTGIY